MEYALALLILLALVALVVTRPLLAGTAEREESTAETRRAELDAAKEAKYREIRDAELDLGMGKLTPEDHRAIDRELRAEAIEILRELDELDELEGRPVQS